MNRRLFLVRNLSKTGLIFVLLLFLIGLMISLSPVQIVKAATPIYVRPDGNDTDCNGTTNDPYPGSGGLDLNCAVQTIQKGVDLVDAGGTVQVAAGTYNETVTIEKQLTVRGATYNVNKNGYTVPANYTWDPTVESIISAPNPFADGIVVDINNTSNVIFEGFVVQSLYSTGGGGIGREPHLLRINARTQTVDNVIIRNNVIGPNTHPSQDGTMGRMGLYLATPGYGGYGLTNSLISSNLIMDAKGKGNNVFIWGAADSYHDLGNTDYSGTIIEDNEISGSHRSGIEIAGGVNNLTIRNNAIHHNSGLPTDDPTNLKYGNGLLVIRTSSDKDNSDAYGPDNLTLSGNEIYSNEKNGIYLGPVNTNHHLTANILRNNGWDGLRIDLVESYHDETGPVYHRVQNIAVTYNQIINNTGYGSQVMGTPTNGFVLDAENNWWGCNYGPGQTGTGCNGTTNGIAGILDADPWLVLDLAANPATILDNETSDLTADLTNNSDSQDTSPGGHLPDGITTTFATSFGAASPTITGTVSGRAFSTYSPGGMAGNAVLSTTVDSQTVTNTVTVESSAQGSDIYLPIVMKAYTQPAIEPDLVVSQIIATDNQVQVVLRNQGNAPVPVTAEFWVDLYVNPNKVPAYNETWPIVADHGAAWGVTQPALAELVPGGVFTLTVSQAGGDTYYWPTKSSLVWPLGSTDQIYAQVDSANIATAYGAVSESIENNNVTGAVNPTVNSEEPSPPSAIEAEAGRNNVKTSLPARP